MPRGVIIRGASLCTRLTMVFGQLGFGRGWVGVVTMKVGCTQRGGRLKRARVGARPIVFVGPSSTVLGSDGPFFVPSFSGRVRCRARLIIHVGQLKGGVTPHFTGHCCSTIAMNVSFATHSLRQGFHRRNGP